MDMQMRVLVANLPFGVIIMIPGGLYGYLRLRRQLNQHAQGTAAREETGVGRTLVGT
jgi:hypothetical protein